MIFRSTFMIGRGEFIYHESQAVSSGVLDSFCYQRRPAKLLPEYFSLFSLHFLSRVSLLGCPKKGNLNFCQRKWENLSEFVHTSQKLPFDSFCLYLPLFSTIFYPNFLILGCFHCPKKQILGHLGLKKLKTQFTFDKKKSVKKIAI